MNFFLKISWVIVLILSSSAFAEEDSSAPAKIERLDQPKTAKPPNAPDYDPDDKALEDLERKRRQRGEREKSLEPVLPPYGLQQKKKLLKEALIPRDRSILIELALLAAKASTRGDRKSYTSDPTVHFNFFYRYDAKKKNGKVGPWYGFRLAPFVGSGIQKKKFGSYGLTYFGPMIGLGKINPVPTQEGNALRAENEAEVKIPAIDGWMIGTGIAAVSKSGRSNDENPEADSDFSTKGAAFDSPGLWIEGRYLKILYGALGYNLIFGIQTGKNKEFIYAGIGLSGWD